VQASTTMTKLLLPAMLNCNNIPIALHMANSAWNIFLPPNNQITAATAM
jgi:hypothetical protein